MTRLLEEQKTEILRFVERKRADGEPIVKTLGGLGVAPSSFYRWRKAEAGASATKPHPRSVTPREFEAIAKVKEEHPDFRHRRIQGELQRQGVYVSATTVYKHLKRLDLVEPYARRPAPWDEPRYEIWRKNTVWGTDWTRMYIGGTRWYLLTLIDFFSRLIVAHDIVPSVNASHVKAIYQAGLAAEGIPKDWQLLPKLRADRGSPNTSDVTKEFFQAIGADLSFARVRRPTDNAITERFYGTIKQEEIYLVGDYPDERSAREEIGRYIRFYNEERPHQSLWNFTPAHVHEVNNKTKLMQMLKALKQKTWTERKEYWSTKTVVTY